MPHVEIRGKNDTFFEARLWARSGGSESVSISLYSVMWWHLVAWIQPERRENDRDSVASSFVAINQAIKKLNIAFV